MPWTAVEDPDGCSAAEPWAVVKLDDGEVVACHVDRMSAEEHVAALYAAEGGKPGEYSSANDPPREATMTNSTNPAGLTVNFNTYTTTGDPSRVWRTVTSGGTALVPPHIFKRDEEPEVEAEEETPESEDEPEDEGKVVEVITVDDEGNVTSEIPEEGEDEETPESEDDEEEADPVDLQGDQEEARTRVHEVPLATKPVTRVASRDHRGLPETVLDRLHENRADVGVIDRVGRAACELRFRPEMRMNLDGTVFLHGYATVYDFPYDVAGGPPLGWSETMVRDSCRVSVMQGADVRFLINHEGIPLARTRSGTLKLENDDIGLYSQAPSLDPRSPTVQSLLSAMNRRDIDEMSFAFKVKEQEWNGDYTERHISEVILFDVSAVTYPANPATVTSLRSDEPTKLDRAEAMRQLRQLQVRGDRLRMQ